MQLDQQEIEQIVKKYGNTLTRIAFNYLKNQSDAEDIMQETFIKLFVRKESFENKQQEKAWLIRVTINLCKDRLRSAWFKNIVPWQESADLFFVKDESILTEVFDLPENYRTVIYLHYYEGYSIKEIANIMNKNEHTIQTWLQRAKVRLKIEIGG